MVKAIFILAIIMFTLLESHGIYAGDGINRKHKLLIEGRVKGPPFLTGFITPVIDAKDIPFSQEDRGIG